MRTLLLIALASSTAYAEPPHRIVLATDPLSVVNGTYTLSAALAVHEHAAVTGEASFTSADDSLPPGIESWTDSSNNENWLAGIIGVINNQFSVYADSKLTKNPVYDKTHAFIGCTGPATDKPLSAGASNALVIFKGAKNVGLAKVLAGYLMHGSALLGIARDSVGLVLPTWQKVWDSDPFYAEGDPAFKTMRDMQEEPLPHKTTTGYTFPAVPSAGRQAANQSYVLTDMMQRILRGSSVTESVQEAQQILIKLFEQQGLKQ